MLNCENITTYKNEFQQIYSVIIFNKNVRITIKKIKKNYNIDTF